jgi:hypothetical protein
MSYKKKLTFSNSFYFAEKLFNFVERASVVERADNYESFAAFVVIFAKERKLVLTSRVKNAQFVRFSINFVPLHIIVLKMSSK